MTAQNTDRVMNKISPIIIGAAALILFIMLFVFIANGNKTNDQNNAYIRVINCIVSYNASSRTQSQIENCYLTVERDSNVSLQRYDSSNK